MPIIARTMVMMPLNQRITYPNWISILSVSSIRIIKRRVQGIEMKKPTAKDIANLNTTAVYHKYTKSTKTILNPQIHSLYKLKLPENPYFNARQRADEYDGELQPIQSHPEWAVMSNYIKAVELALGLEEE